MASLTTGIALGGVAEGFDQSEKRGLQERQLGLQEKGIGLKERALKFERFKKITENIRTLAAQAQEVKKARPDGAESFIAPLRRQVQIAAQAAAVDLDRPELVESLVQSFDALVAGTPNALESAKTKGQATAVETAAAVTGLEQIPGADPQAIRVKQGLVAAPKAPATQNYRKGDKIVAVDLNAPDARVVVGNLLKEGYIETRESVQATDATGLPGLQKKEAVEFRDAQTATLNALQTLGRVSEQLTEGGAGILSVTGATKRFLVGMTSQIDAMASSFGGSATVNGKDANNAALRDEKLYDFSKFSGDAAKSTAIQSNVIDLAYALARSAEPGGRLSDRDVQAQIDRLGSSSGDPDMMRAALREVQSSIQRSITNRALVLKQTVAPEVQAEISKDHVGGAKAPSAAPSGVPKYKIVNGKLVEIK